MVFMLRWLLSSFAFLGNKKWVGGCLKYLRFCKSVLALRYDETAGIVTIIILSNQADPPLWKSR